ncbi:hypothetical protein JJL56_12090 [Azospirillum sp. YIM DDC1]|uniref:Uncharacterized protein n=2 Tax=Azospirillum aestuarii TaxID=2802052 RepID=A0ABS1HYV2_9PROT|nr:hypothetical protein [Azospirillum brasilense]MBK4719612.1 hypothetical protein [Azospirillum aestuarii]
MGLTSRSVFYDGLYAGGGVAFEQAVWRAGFRYLGAHQSAASADACRSAGGILEETPMTFDRNAEPPLPQTSPPSAPACGSLWNDYLHRLLGTAHGCVAANDDESDPEPACCCAAG